MPVFPHQSLRTFGYALFEASGLPADQARCVTDHLVDADLMGHNSHGVIRIPSYVEGLRKGSLRPAGAHRVVRETPASLVIDAGGAIGIAVARLAMDMAVERALAHTFGAVAVHRAGHIGRLGDFPPKAAERGCIGILLLNGGSRFTAPFGGTGRRLPPNPISIAVPTRDGPPMVLDITTSMAAGGKIDVFRARKQPLPVGWLIDAAGAPVTDTEVFREGKAAMLPLGGPAGHKGYGLGMMVDAIAGGLSWAGCSAERPTRGGSGFLALAVRIESFIDLDEFTREVQILIDWVRSSPLLPGVGRIYIPGEVEEETRRKREAEGVFIDEATWEELRKAAQNLQVAEIRETK